MAKQKTAQTGKQKSIPLDAALAAFLTDRAARGYTARTVGFYSARLPHFLTWCTTQNAASLTDITPAILRAYLVTLQGRKLAPNTVHGHARAIRAFLRFCAADEMIDAAPAVPMPKLPKTILPALTPEDVRKLLDACTCQRDRAIVLCLVDSGFRAAEFVALEGRDIDAHAGVVAVRMGKGQKDRVTYLGAKARRELLRYWKETGKPLDYAPVWVSLNTGERLTHWGLRLILQRLGDRAGVEHCHPHTFRRTCALWSLRAGMNIYALQRMLGHEDLQTLKRYLALVEGDVAAAHKAHGAVDSMLK